MRTWKTTGLFILVLRLHKQVTYQASYTSFSNRFMEKERKDLLKLVGPWARVLYLFAHNGN